MSERHIGDLMTPAGLVDVERMRANLDRMAAYTAEHALALRPHIKTHKIPELAAEQLARGAAGITAATTVEARVMATVASDILVAYPPVGRARIERLLALPDSVRLTVGLDSAEALDAISAAAARAGRTIGVLVEMDLGMGRVGLHEIKDVLALVRRATGSPGIEWRGLMFYPGHIREHVTQQGPALRRLSADLRERLERLREAGFEPEVVSAGSTPAAFSSHEIEGVTEIRPGTYIFNDRTTAEIGACTLDDCAYTVLATVVSTAVPGQAVVDAGSKALGREPLRASGGDGFGVLLDRPEVRVRAMSEEHGILDLSETDWRPGVGDPVRIIPNHVCYSVNLQPRLWAVRGQEILGSWTVAARGWS